MCSVVDPSLEAAHSQIARIFDERLADLQRRAFDGLSQAARRIRQFEDEDQWGRALVEATAGLCGRAILFAVNRPMLEFRAGHNVAVEALGPAAIPITSAPAFASAIESKETVVALRTRGELSESIVNLTGETPEKRCSLFPFVTRGRVAAILYADSNDGRLETSALELIATLGAAVMEGQPARPIAWDARNLRAQRVARVQVAQIRLLQSQAVKDGRLHADLYTYLKSEIDSGREAFRRDFLSVSPAMTDYFHLELVQTLANDDATLLGKEYPGPMVAGN